MIYKLGMLFLCVIAVTMLCYIRLLLQKSLSYGPVSVDTKDSGKDAVVHGFRHHPERNSQQNEDNVNAYCHRQSVNDCAVKALRLRRRRFKRASTSAKLYYANLQSDRKICRCVKFQIFLKWYLVHMVCDVGKVDRGSIWFDGDVFEKCFCDSVDARYMVVTDVSEYQQVQGLCVDPTIDSEDGLFEDAPCSDMGAQGLDVGECGVSGHVMLTSVDADNILRISRTPGKKSLHRAV